MAIDFHGVHIPDVLTRSVSGTYEQEEMGYALDLFEAGDKVIVGGGGMGWLLAWIATIVGPRNVLGVEPQRDKQQLIEANVEVDGTLLRCLWGGLTPYGVSAAMAVDAENWASSRVTTDMKRARQGELPAVPGHDLLDLMVDGWDCLALDIEGMEAHVLTAPVLARTRRLLLEIHDPVLTADEREGLDEQLRRSSLVMKARQLRERDGTRIENWSR